MKLRRYLPHAAAMLCLLLIFFAYLTTANPSFKNNDSPEIAVAAFTLSPAHPPGYPVYILLGKAAMLIPLGNPAFRMNILAILLSVMSLLMVYAIAERFLRQEAAGARAETWPIRVPASLLAVLIAASGCVFWNQSIEAKGGIYMLNMFFILSIIYLAAAMHETPKLKYFLMTAFIYGLSLANHWQTMVLMAPVALYPAIILWKKANTRVFIWAAVLFVIGLSPYLFYALRNATASPFVWGDFKNVSGMFSYVFRLNYMPVESVRNGGFLARAAAIAAEFLRSYGAAGILILPGIYALHKKNAMLFYTLAYTAAAVAIAVVLYDNTPAHMLRLVDIFAMPAVVILSPVIFSGAIHVAGLFKSRTRYVLFLALVTAAVVFTGAKNFGNNDSSGYFIGYDLAMNEMKTMEEGSAFISEGDCNSFSFAYMQGLHGYRKDIMLIFPQSLYFSRGISRLHSLTGVDFPQESVTHSILRMIAIYAPDRGVFRNSPSEVFETAGKPVYVPVHQLPEGILVRFTPYGGIRNLFLFDMYSYRGVHRYFRYNPENYLAISWYFWAMINTADAAAAEGKLLYAASIYNKCLLMPGDKPENEVLYKLACVYRDLKDAVKEEKYLKRTVEKDGSNTQVLERLGKIMYDRKNYAEASLYLGKAAANGSKNREVNGMLNTLRKQELH